MREDDTLVYVIIAQDDDRFAELASQLELTTGRLSKSMQSTYLLREARRLPSFLSPKRIASEAPAEEEP